MQPTIHFMLVMAFNVCAYESQDIWENIADHRDNIITMPTSPTIDVGAVTQPTKQDFVMTEKACYVGHSMCYHDEQKEVCAHHKDYKLVGFESPCDLHLQNCLYRAEREAKKPNVPENFYFNDNDKACQYYFEKGKTLEDAIKFYYLDGLKQNLQRKDNY